VAAVGENQWPCVYSNRWPLKSSPEARRAANGEPQTGHRSPIGSPFVLYRRVLHVRHLRCGIGSLLLVVRSRHVRVARIARTDRVRLGPGTARRLRVQASLGVDRRGNPPRAVIASQLAAADALPNLVVSASSSPRLPIPLLEPRARKRARTPARPTGLGRGHRPGGVTPVEQDTGPAVKTSGPRLPPRDAKRAVGGIRAWGENPGRRASSLTTVLPFWTFACADPKVVCADLSAGIGELPANPRRARTPTASPPRDHRTRPRSEQSAMPIGIPVQRNARATMPRGLEKPARRPRAASATGRMRPRRDRARAADP
jgi:hypothetical protein